MAQKSITNFFKRKCDTSDGDLDISPKGAKIEPEPVTDKCEGHNDEKRIKIEPENGSEEKKSVPPLSENGSSNINEKSVPPPAKNSSTKLMKISDVYEIGDDYNPGKDYYDPIKDAFWEKGANTPYLALAKTFQIIEETRGRLKMIEILSNFFSSVIVLSPQDLLASVYLSVNQLAPAYEGLELGVAEKTLMKVISSTTGRDLNQIKSKTQATGDLGIVAEQSRIAQRTMFHPTPLTIRDVFAKLKKIASLPGKSKYTLIQDVFVSCRFCEARYFIRCLIGKLRIGVAEQSLLQALAVAVASNAHTDLSGNNLKSKIEEFTFTLKTVYSQCPNYDRIINALLEHGIVKWQVHCGMEPGIPLKPMLAQPTRSIQDIFSRFEDHPITCEYKYDGERAQIHYQENKEVSIYSRNQENITAKYPDVIARIADFKGPEVTSFILDTEIVAWDVERSHILPFQELSKRKRKNVQVEDIKIKVCIFAFDLLYLNGKPLIAESLFERRKLLQTNFQEKEGEWKFPDCVDTNNLEEIQQCLDNSIKGNCEGLMIKTLHSDATYEISKRSRNWLKLKKDYISNVGDSLDLVVIGGYIGKGKRKGTYGGYLLACYDEENEEYQSICKIGTGFTEEDLQTHSASLAQHVILEPKLYYRYDTNMEPDVWFEPVEVWEVKCADLSLSPAHKAAIGIIDPERGISLRFPRFIRLREDKSPENATSAQQVADMYNSQDQIKNHRNVGGGTNHADDDYY